MEQEQWLEKVRQNREDLRGLIAYYHPSNLAPHSPTEIIPANITAPNAERACEVVREQIRKETMLDCPEAQFDIAISNNDCQTIYTLLSSTWFGVPESTDCWRIPGFKVAVDLLDDPIEFPEEP